MESPISSSGTPSDSQSRNKSNSTRDSAPKAEYKEYTFETNPNKEIEDKVASFWKEIGERKPPKADFFKAPDFNDCLDISSGVSDDGLEEEEDALIDRANKFKWTNTFCMFKKRGLKEVATAAVAKQCTLCSNENFAPDYADEQCLQMMQDYGHTPHDD